MITNTREVTDEEFEAMIEEVPEPVFQVQQVSHQETYLDELDAANRKIDQLYHFIEMTEALTYDQATAKRIRSFLQEEGVWNDTKRSQTPSHDTRQTTLF